MSALAMFSSNYHSLLHFEDNYPGDKKVQHNLRSLCGVDKLSSDTYMRQSLYGILKDCLDHILSERPSLKSYIPEIWISDEHQDLVFC
jgi:hypothetical protein